MTKEELSAKVDEILGKANVKVSRMYEAKGLKMNPIAVETTEDAVSVLFGGQVAASASTAEPFKAFMAIKRAIWGLVDSTRDELGLNDRPAPAVKNDGGKGPDAAKANKPQAQAHRGDLAADLKKMVETANVKLADIVSGGFPFTIAEVEMRIESDLAGWYLYSGMTPVKVLSKSSKEIFASMKAAIWDTVDATRVAVERRGRIKADAEMLVSESNEMRKAEDAGVDLSALHLTVPTEIAEAITAAARRAVALANRGLPIDGNSRLHLRSYRGGLVVVSDAMKSFGEPRTVIVRGKTVVARDIVSVKGKPCLVTRWPKVSSPDVVKKLIGFIKADISALGESRRKYLWEVEKIREQEQTLRRLSAEMANVTDRIRAMA